MTIIFKGKEVTNLEIDGVDHSDHPDYCDAYFSYATYAGFGIPLTDDELEELTNERGDVIYEMASEQMIDHAESLRDMMMDR